MATTIKINEVKIKRVMTELERYFANEVSYEEFCVIVRRLVAMTAGRGRKIKNIDH